jgi:hypothetical protein
MSDDNFRGMNPRILGGASLRYRLIDKEQSELIIGTGSFYEYEQWKHPSTEQLVFARFVKSSTNLVFRYTFSEALHANGVLYYQFGYDSSIDKIRNRYSGDINLNSKITKRLSLTNTFSFSYEDRPIVPITRFIFSLETGITFEL